MYLPLFSRQLWPAAAVRNRSRFSGGIRDWIMSGAWSLNEQLTKKSAKLILHDVDQFGEASVNEALYLANAAFESARAVPVLQDEPRSFAWQFIAYYYSGYFAANSLMRLCGYGCTNLSALECAEINQSASLYGLGGNDDKTKLAPGVFYASTSNSVNSVCSLTSIGSKGGVHIQFWTGFLKFLLELEKHIKQSVLPKAERDAALSELNDLISALKYDGAHSGAWLSEVRNGLNYRLGYGAWFPYDDSVTDGDKLRLIISDAVSGKIFPPKVAQAMPDPERAAKTSAFLLSWLHESMKTLEVVAGTQRKKAVQAGPIEMAAALL
jgi:hypothetical protein